MVHEADQYVRSRWSARVWSASEKDSCREDVWQVRGSSFLLQPRQELLLVSPTNSIHACPREEKGEREEVNMTTKAAAKSVGVGYETLRRWVACEVIRPTGEATSWNRDDMRKLRTAAALHKLGLSRDAISDALLASHFPGYGRDVLCVPANGKPQYIKPEPHLLREQLSRDQVMFLVDVGSF